MFLYFLSIWEHMNTMFTSSIIALAAILLVPFSPHAANASSCSAQGQANDKSGLHNVGPVTVSSGTGSCSISFSSRAGEGNVFAPKSHIIGQSAFNDPGFKTGTCASTSAGPNGLSRNFDDGQHSSDRSCSTHSP
jgi:hypothetical protein